MTANLPARSLRHARRPSGRSSRVAGSQIHGRNRTGFAGDLARTASPQRLQCSRCADAASRESAGQLRGSSGSGVGLTHHDHPASARRMPKGPDESVKLQFEPCCTWILTSKAGVARSVIGSITPLRRCQSRATRDRAAAQHDQDASPRTVHGGVRQQQGVAHDAHGAALHARSPAGSHRAAAPDPLEDDPAASKGDEKP
jgi:hypothetical protein